MKDYKTQKGIMIMNKTTVESNEIQEVYNTFYGIGIVWDLMLVKGFVLAGLLVAKCFGAF